MIFFQPDFLSKKTMCYTVLQRCKGPSKKYAHKFYQKSNISYPLIRTHIVFVDASMMHLKTIILKEKFVSFDNRLQKKMC